MDGMKIDESLIPKIIGIVVAVIVVAVALIPITEEATATTTTFENDGYYNMTYSEADNLTLTWEYTNPNVITINDEPITLSVDTLPGPLNVICGNDWFLRWAGDSVQFYSTANGSVSAAVANSTSFSLTASNGSATAINTASTPVSQTVSYTFMYVVDPNGLYVMKNSTDSAYLKGDSEVYAIGRSSFTGIVIKIKITGNIEDGFTAEEVGNSGVSATVGTPVATYETVNGYNDLYKLSKIEVPIEYLNSGTPASFTPTYSYFIVPAEVTAEKAIHADTMTNIIISIIPIFVVLAILMGIVGLMYFNRNGQ